MICESLDGNIQVSSTPNQGSSFAFTMKVIEDSELLSSTSSDEKSQADSSYNSIEEIETRDQQNLTSKFCEEIQLGER